MSFNHVKRKISNPPSAQNFVRLVDVDDEIQTTKNIVEFSMSIPSFNYIPGTKMCLERVRLGLDLSTAISAVRRAGAPSGRQHNEDFVRAFYAYDEVRNYSSCPAIENYSGQYRISREICIPTAPTFTIIEGGKQVPVLTCGWKSVALSRSQRQLWMTLLESGLFSYGDYRRSPAEIAMFPESPPESGGKRAPEIIMRGDLPCYSEYEMRDIAAMYVRAQSAAMEIAYERWQQRQRRIHEGNLIDDAGLPAEDHGDVQFELL